MDYVAKRNPVLETLKKDLDKGYLEDVVTVHGHKFKISTLTEDEETWADMHLRANSAAAMYSSRRAPRLAAAIKELDGVLAQDLFSFSDDMPKVVKDRLAENPIEKRYWIRDQMLMFLLEDSNRPFITDLYEVLTKLDDKRDEAIKAIPN
jgi:hypothetical protein